MAKPTSDPTWATDAAYASDGDAWGGDANKVDPGAPRRAEGVEPDAFPAEWFNYHLNALGAHTEYLHAIVEADGSESIPAVVRTLILSPLEFRPLRDSGTPALPIGSVDGSGFLDSVDLTDPLQVVGMPLNRLLPFGAGVTQIDLLIFSGTHTTTEGRLSVFAAQPNWATPGMGAVTEVSGDNTISTGFQLLTVTTAFAIGSTFLHYLVYNPGNITSGADQLYAIRIQYTDPGPRNF